MINHPTTTYNNRKKKAFVLFGAWSSAQAAWLLFAYRLEFRGHNTFGALWLAGVAFFLVNMLVLASLVRNYNTTPLADSEPSNRSKAD